jgi:KaiC/GvpD/RAD55 family RecA-like ATPase
MTKAADVTSYEELANALEAAGSRIKGKNCTCPWHDDANPSASIICDDDGHWRVYCHVCEKAGDVIDILTDKGASVKELLGSEDTKAKRQPPPVKRYPSHESAAEAMAIGIGEIAGTYVYEVTGMSHPALVVVRIDTGTDTVTGKKTKTFRQVSFDGDGWVAKSPPKPWPLYRLPEVRDAKSVVVCEGEKAADAIRAIGLVGTTSPCGAGKAANADWSALSGKRVVIWPDHDEVGAKHADDVSEILFALPTPPERIARIDPVAIGVPAKGDAVEAIAAITGDKRDGIIAILKGAAEVGKRTPYDEVKESIDDAISGKTYLVGWPWPVLTKITRSLLPGKVIILAGPPGSAKSWFALQCVLHMIETCEKVAMLALEETFAWYSMRAMSWLSGNLDVMKPEWSKANPDDAKEMLAKYAPWVDSLGKVYTCNDEVTFDDCATWVEEKCKGGARVLWIDPISLADPGKKNSWEADREFMARVKSTIKKYGASLVLITHPRKTSQKQEIGMDGLSGGAAYQRAAGSVLWIQGLGEETDCEVEDIHGQQMHAVAHKRVLVLKSRDSNGAGQGVAFRFHNCQFHELGRVVK